ncbi:unnamed protein product [Oreochromis niloticus]|nr:unnamed protein product [Mustela putorius furo]
MQTESDPPSQDSLKACKFSLLGRIYFSVSVFEDTPPPSRSGSLSLFLSESLCLSSRMNVLLSISLWLALVVPSCRGNTRSPQDDNYMPTPTPEYDDDYDYNATFDYYYVTMAHDATNSTEDTTMIIPTEISENKVYDVRNTEETEENSTGLNPAGNTGSPQDDNYMPTPTPEYDDDYDYNATFDYYYVTMAHDATNSTEDTTMIIPTEISGNKVYNPRNTVSRTGQPTLVLSLGLAVLHLWN